MFANAFPCRAVNQSAWMNRAEVSVSSGPATMIKGTRTIQKMESSQTWANKSASELFEGSRQYDDS